MCISVFKLREGNNTPLTTEKNRKEKDKKAALNSLTKKKLIVSSCQQKATF